MEARRGVLVAGLGLLIASAVHRHAAGATDSVGGDVEVDAYGGRNSGGWACGPTGRLSYGGLSGQVRVRERDLHSEQGPGLSAQLAVGAERQGIKDAHCTQSDLSDCEYDATGAPIVPPDHWMGGGTAVGRSGGGSADWEGSFGTVVSF